MTAKICRVTLTGGNVRNHQFSLRSCSEIIPAGGIGGKNATETGSPFTVKFEPGMTVETDLDGTKMILRNRQAVRDFFERTAVAEGDVILLESSGERTLFVRVEGRAEDQRRPSA